MIFDIWQVAEEVNSKHFEVFPIAQINQTNSSKSFHLSYYHRTQQLDKSEKEIDAQEKNPRNLR